MADATIVYYVKRNVLRNQSEEKVAEVQQAIEAIRNLPFSQESIVTAVSLLGYGLAADRRLDEINLTIRDQLDW